MPNVTVNFERIDIDRDGDPGASQGCCKVAIRGS